MIINWPSLDLNNCKNFKVDDRWENVSVFLKFQLVHLGKEVGKCLVPKQNLFVLDEQASVR